MTRSSRAAAADGVGHAAVTYAAATGRARAGLPVDPGALPPAGRRTATLATQLGAPLAPVLAAAARVEEERRELRRAVELAATEGRSVARALVLAPPLLGPATALLVTDDPWAVWATSGGRVVLVLASCLWLLGWSAVRVLVRRATVLDDPGDELLELVAVGLDAGLALPAAVRRADAVLGRSRTAGALWLELGASGPPPPGWEVLGPVLASGLRDGTPLVPVVRALAAALRRQAHHRALTRAARLGPRLTVPTTLLLLPAAGLLIAAPLLHGLLAGLR